ncbi:TetR/AcrR family transcriptional regulator [Streptomyces sp. TG1A-8]|uniref:TetR/AcrR family transcriptional regulator n=1 Tax=Streptomyces sp. TG1A-8 TaxID=3051385 RepID=UPI00265BF3ED|nr:TetR/AcrR family transcriptional regulator [Streptomyces sp. TG1A-8]MDO0925799.1 TetR/AcrR family transcriptional regulator [Streptomyces sp. TG1A-8]
MPPARESLLDAAYTALVHRPWSAVRMVDVAAAAGVSRQTLYNEFGSKGGLARALVRREADGYLAGVDRALAGPAEPRGRPATGAWDRPAAAPARGRPTAADAQDRLTATAEWTASAARDNALVRALLTGCWNERLPQPAVFSAPSFPTVPAQRRVDGAPPSPGDFVRTVRDRAVKALTGPGAAPFDTTELARSCELVVRLALSCVTAPPAGEGGVAVLVRAVLQRQRAVR